MWGFLAVREEFERNFDERGELRSEGVVMLDDRGQSLVDVTCRAVGQVAEASDDDWNMASTPGDFGERLSDQAL